MISESDMSRMQQEAARRVNEMHNRTSRPIAPQQSKPPPPSRPPLKNEPPPPQPKPPPIPSAPPCPPVPSAAVSGEHGSDILEILMNDKERNLILLMIILLMGENCDYTLLLALLYLLI